MNSVDKGDRKFRTGAIVIFSGMPVIWSEMTPADQSIKPVDQHKLVKLRSQVTSWCVC